MTKRSLLLLQTHMGTKHATIKPFACGACGDCFALQSPHRPHERQAQGGQDEAAERGQAAGAPAAAEGVSPGHDGSGGGESLN